MKKTFLAVVLFPVALFCAVACVVSGSDAIGSSSAGGASGSAFSADKAIFVDVASVKAGEETADTDVTASGISLLDGTVTVTLSNSVLKIDSTDIAENLAVNLTGTNDTSKIGGVKIQTTTDYEIGLYLNGVSITSTNYPCIELTKGGAVSVFLTGANTLTDGRTYGYGYGSEYADTSQNYVAPGSDAKGTLYCKGSLAVSGDGSLSVTQGYKNCIASKDGVLTVESGTLTLKNYTASSTNPLSDYESIQNTKQVGKNGLFGGQGVTIKGGAVTFYGCGIISATDIRKANGIKTDDDDYPNSYVNISGGTLNITTYNGKGITAPYIYISGGTNTITVDGTTSYTGDASGGMGGNAFMFGGQWHDNPPPPPPRFHAREMGMGGGNPGHTGGTQGNNGAGGGSSSGTSYSGYDADGVAMSGTFKFAPEGIEGDELVEITGGTTEVSATDDGINVSGSSPVFSMSGGSLYVSATKGDGIDSNGSLYLRGGTVVSYAPTGSEDAYDSDGKTYISGGVIAGVCGSSMGLSEYSTSGQKVLYFTNASYKSVAVEVGGSTVYAFTLPSSSSGVLVMSCPHFTSSSASDYTVYTSPTISGGENFHGLYSDVSDVSVGSATAVPKIK